MCNMCRYTCTADEEESVHWGGTMGVTGERLGMDR